MTYPQSGSFVGHLFETYGLPPFRAVYADAPLDPDGATFDRLLTAAYGKDLDALEDRGARGAGRGRLRPGRAVVRAPPGSA